MTARTTEELLKAAEEIGKFYTERADMAVIEKFPSGELTRERAKLTGVLIAELSAKLRESEELVKVVENLSRLHDAIDNHTKSSLYQWIHVLGRDAKAALNKPTPPKKES